MAAIIAASAERAAHFQQNAPKSCRRCQYGSKARTPPDWEAISTCWRPVLRPPTILEALPENTTLTFDGPSTSEKKYTWNALGILRGSDPNLQRPAVLLSAHLDHLGIGPAGEWR